MSGRLGSFVAGMASGYGTMMAFQRQSKEDQYRDEVRERERKDRKDADDLKVALSDAGKPVAVESGETYQPVNDDDGNAMPANPTAGTFAVKGVRFDSREKADAAANVHNSSTARAARIAGVLDERGRPLEAMKLRGEAQNLEANSLQLDEAKEASGVKKFARAAVDSIGKGGWGGFAKFATDSYNDGFSYQAVENGKGGAVIQRIDKDGKPAGEQSFATAADAIGYAVGRADPAKWLERSDKQAEIRRDQGNKDREFGLDKERFALTSDATKAGIRQADARVALGWAGHNLDAQRTKASVGMAEAHAAAYRAAASAGTGLPQFDEKSELGFAHDIAKDEAKNAAATGGERWTENQIALRAQGIVGARRQAWTNDMGTRAAGNTLRQASSDPQAYAAAWDRVTKAGVDPKGLEQQGFRPPAAAPASPASPAAPAGARPPPARPATPAGAAAAGVAGPAPQGMAQQFNAFLAQNITTPQGKAAIAQRSQAELPVLQQRAAGLATTLQNQQLPPAVRAQLSNELDQIGQVAAAMQNFIDGNPGR